MVSVFWSSIPVSWLASCSTSANCEPVADEPAPLRSRRRLRSRASRRPSALRCWQTRTDLEAWSSSPTPSGGGARGSAWGAAAPLTIRPDPPRMPMMFETVLPETNRPNLRCVFDFDEVANNGLTGVGCGYARAYMHAKYNFQLRADPDRGAATKLPPPVGAAHDRPRRPGRDAVGLAQRLHRGHTHAPVGNAVHPPSASPNTR